MLTNVQTSTARSSSKKKASKSKTDDATLPLTMVEVIDTTGIDITAGQATTRNPPLKVTSSKSRKPGNVMDAHNQFMTRPADEAVFSFEDLLARTSKARTTSTALEPMPWSSLQVRSENKSLTLVGPSGGAKLGHWATKQLCSVIDTPSEYILRLPPELAADCLNHGIANQWRRKGDALMLLQSNDTGSQLVRSITSDIYERVWDAEIAELADGLRTNGTWGPCQAFKSATKAKVDRAWAPAKTLPLGWVGDRSSFIALADYEGAVKVNGSLLARFALLSNSEVGAQGFKIVFGLMDFACANFILWGCEQVTEVSVRHVGSIRERFAALTAPMTKALTSGERDHLTGGLTTAQKTLIADDQDKVFARVAQVTRLPKAHIEAAWNVAEGTPRYGNPRSVWGMLSGLTEASQKLHENADKRTKADEQAARLMSLVG
jgi:hypothetical protein